jgi:thioredoxin-like negative regulator of GroEL
MKIINIENKNQLLAAKYEYKYVIFLIYGDKCEPCQTLKPKLIEFLQKNDTIDRNFALVMVNYKSSKEINAYFDLKKIPFLIFCMDSDIKGSIQSSKMELVIPEMAKSFDLDLDLIPDLEGGAGKEDELDFTGDFDF